MMNPELPPGFVEFTSRLAQTQEKSRDAADTGCLSGFLVGMCACLVALLLAFPTGEALRQASFTFGATGTAEAEVVRVDKGDPVVRFTTGDGELIHSWLPHEHRADDPRTLEVTYRVDHPEAALAADHPRSLSGPVLLLLLAAWVLFELFHRRGLRAGWFWRRARTLVKGPLTRTEQKQNARRTKRVEVPPGSDRPARGPLASALAGTVLVLGGLAMVSAVPVRDPGVWMALAGMPLAFGICLLRAALGRYADTAPVTNPPRPFWLLPRGAAGWAAPVLLVAALTVTIPTLPTGNEAGPPRSGAEVPGQARIVDDGCHNAGRGGSCEAYVVLEYRANGMDYREQVVVDLLGLDELVAREPVRIAWDLDDPRRVRLVNP
jgi:hypothetical protein